MSARASPRLRLWPFVSPTARVSSGRFVQIAQRDTNSVADANQFKEAFIKAQQENEALFGKSEQ
jgi:hypothetical protein